MEFGFNPPPYPEDKKSEQNSFGGRASVVSAAKAYSGVPRPLRGTRSKGRGREEFGETEGKETEKQKHIIA